VKSKNKLALRAFGAPLFRLGESAGAETTSGHVTYSPHLSTIPLVSPFDLARGVQDPARGPYDDGNHDPNGQHFDALGSEFNPFAELRYCPAP